MVSLQVSLPLFEFFNLYLLLVDRPITYLYNTLHYYERILRDRLPLKKKLVSRLLQHSRNFYFNTFCHIRLAQLQAPLARYVQPIGV